MKLFIGSSSSEMVSYKYLDDCKKFLDDLFLLKYDLVFGACNKGIMGLSYEAAIKNGSMVVGICPSAYKDDLELIECEGILTSSISERTDRVIEESDVLIFLPGGIGTIYELFTAIESKRSHEFDKPIIIYNSCGYFDKMLEFMDLMYEEKFASSKVKDNYYVCDSSEEVIRYLNEYCNLKGKSSSVKKRKML